MVPVELWNAICKFSSLPVDRKYQKGQSRDNSFKKFGSIIKKVSH
jgi:hypothetical protein